MTAGTDFGRFSRGIRKGLDPAAGSRWQTPIHNTLNFLLVVGLAAVVLGTVADIRAAYDGALTAVALIVAGVYSAEYVVRLYQAPFDRTVTGDGGERARGRKATRLRLRWAVSPLGLVDLVGAVPVPLALSLGIAPATARLLGILWILKLVRTSPAFALVARVIRNERRPLLGVALGFLAVLLIAATGAYLLERDSQPTTFGSIPGALWWAVVTLTTTGYGDEVPITVAGRILAGLTMVSGIGMFALWAGILASGFAQEVRRQDFLMTWTLVAQVPLFSNLGAATIADVARLLRPREMAGGRTVLREGEPGDCMYFIVGGEVEVRLKPEPVRLGPGGFFGEMALITGDPRTATVVTTAPSILLRLDVADFHGLAAEHSELVEAIAAAATRRGAGAIGLAQPPRI